MTDSGQEFSPKAFLKSRRPERFSDSQKREVTELDRSYLEYHLDTLSSRGQENDFEAFARQLCQREVCPNLLPQTGPTGGGDSKVDGETYPVADSLTFLWHLGIGREAASERWAFAYSIKKDWAPKVRSDIAKIANTNRSYKKAFFVSNQAVPDKKRGAMEDELRKKHGIDVRIFDRTWILDRIFRGGHEDLAIEVLGAKALSNEREVTGPADSARKEVLGDIEKSMSQALLDGQVAILPELAIEAADLARQLELPRVTVEGYYTRARDLCEKHGSPRQQKECAYQWAWTLYYWFEDFESFARQYAAFERAAKGTRQAYDLVQQKTLWSMLMSAVEHGFLDQNAVKLKKKTKSLKAALQAMSIEGDRPSNALQAETSLLFMDLIVANRKDEPVDHIVRGFKEVILKSNGLAGYPLEETYAVLQELSPALEESSAYDELFETLVSAWTAQRGELSAARMLVKRGTSQFQRKLWLEAIKTFGQSLARLYRHESKDEAVEALYLIGQAYEQAGLPWAARGALINAANLAADEFWVHDRVTVPQMKCYERIKWVELRLGRLAHALDWHQLDQVIKETLVSQGLPDELFQYDPNFDTLLGALLLHADERQLSELERLPDLLSRLGLPLSCDLLLFALGHEDRFSQGAEMAGVTAEELANQCWHLSIKEGVAEVPVWYDGQPTVVLEGKALGCTILVSAETEGPCIEIAESFLGALQSFLSTLALRRSFAFEPRLTVSVTRNEMNGSHSKTTDVDELVRCEFEDRLGRPHINVGCQSFDPSKLSGDQDRQVKGFLLNAVLSAMAHIVMLKDVEAELTSLFDVERVGDRAMTFAVALKAQANVLGYTPKNRLAFWTKLNDSSYKRTRPRQWRAVSVAEPVQTSQPPRFSDEEPPDELVERYQKNEGPLGVVSHIRIALWDKAKWSGVVYSHDPDEEDPPGCGLVFENEAAGRDIFLGWRSDFGQIDKNESLRIVAVKGISKSAPHSYRMHIGSNLPNGGSDGIFIMASRFKQMDPKDPENLEGFIRRRSAVGAFWLFPAFVPKDWDGSRSPKLGMELGILVRNLEIREAWQIGVNDPDCVVIRKGDDPIIPRGRKDAPVRKLLAKLEKA